MADDGLQVRILGPLEVTMDGAIVALGGPKRRAALAVLAVRANRVVPEDVLAEAVWGLRPPPSARNTLQGYVSNLRRLLEPDRPPHGASRILPASDAGYALRVDPDRIDAVRFERLVADGRDALARGAPAAAAAALDEARALWRSDGLEAFASDPMAGAETARLEELHLGALEDWFEAGLRLGRHARLIGELQRLVTLHPLRERMWGQLMVALYRAGRQGESLRSYQRARRLLAEELGVDPCLDLQRLESAVLVQDPSLDLHGGGPLAAAPGTSPIRPPPPAPVSEVFVGRDRELLDFCGHWAQAQCGRGRVVAVVGEAGMGKTSLAREFSAVVEADGGRALCGRSWQGEGAPALWPWAQVVRTWAAGLSPGEVRACAGRGRAHVARAFPDLADVLGADPASSRRDDDGRRARFDALAGMLARSARLTPLLVVLEDVHFADTLSLRFLEFLCQQTDDLRLLVVATARDGEPGANPGLARTFAELARGHWLHRIPLGGLSTTEVERLVVTATGVRPSEAVVRELVRLTQGNPFFVTEMVRALHADGDLAGRPDRLPVPEAVRDVVHRRLDHLSRAAVRVLTIAAIVGDQFRAEVLEQVSDLKGERLLDALDEAVAARVVAEVAGEPGCYTFGHALHREALAAGLTVSRRAYLHRRVAEAISAMAAADPDRHAGALAHHLLEGATPGDAGPAVAAALAAARASAARYAYEDAVGLLTRAHALLARAAGPDAALRAEVSLALGDAHNRLGELDRARRSLLDAADAARRAGTAEHLGLAAAGFAAVVRPDGDPDGQCLALLEDALDALGPVDGRARALVLSRLARWRHHQGRDEEGWALSGAAVRMADRWGDPALLRTVLDNVHWALYGPDHIRARLVVAARLLALAEERGDPELAAQGHEWRLRDLLELGELEQAEEASLLLRRAAREAASPRYGWYAATHSAMVACLQGRFEEAEHLAFAALDLGREVGSRHPTRRRSTRRDRPAELAFDVQLFALRWLQGRAGDLIPTFEALLDSAPSTDGWLLGLATLYADEGRDDEARPLYEKVRARGFDAIRRDVEWLPKVATLARLARTLGDREGAAGLYAMLLPYEARNCVILELAFFGSVSHALGRLARAMGRHDDAVRHFRAAVERHRRMGADPWVAVSEFALAATLMERHQAGDWARARSLQEEARVTAARLGMVGLERRLRAMHALASSRATADAAPAPAVPRAGAVPPEARPAPTPA
ncbi:MAG: BTAD domain-containing putative transcriptional regulator [Acidimicrobiales bacterium]